jgi:hypothetical protein
MRFIPAISRLALACWLGGAALFTFVLTPAIFAAYDRDLAGGIVGVLFPGYFRWGLACGLVALICQLLTAHRRWLPLLLLTGMMALTAVQALIIEPRAAALKKQIPSFVTTPTDHPLRREFRRLHGISAAANLAVILGGMVLVVCSGDACRRHDKGKAD